MTTNIIVGYNGTDGGRDALALALQSVRVGAGDDHHLTVASIYPADPGDQPARTTVPAYDRAMRQDAEERLAEPRRHHRDRGDVTFEVRGDTSPARALHALARERDAAAIAVGRSHTTAVTRPFIGSVTEQTIHGAPCAVLVAPTGYAARTERAAAEPASAAAGTIAVAYDGGPESAHALHLAAAVARERGAALSIVQVVEPLAVPYGGLAIPYPLPDRRREAQDALDRTAASIEDLPVTALAVEGLAVDVLSATAQRADLLVVGSRGFGPVRRVLLGSVSSRLARHCDAPLLVLPRVSEDGGDDDGGRT